ncbi:hypothetical protein QYG89_12825 [Bacillus sp. B190/17]|uniref:Uncharacterized protein n=1 Tax=Bacillus lumedeiriae TaxID=3058829 RepID=A0ABW8IBK0_9BACI
MENWLCGQLKGEEIVLNSWIVGMFFLYFPEDKTEYIPAVISMVIFVAAAIALFMYFRKVSKREEEKINKKYGEIKKQ